MELMTLQNKVLTAVCGTPQCEVIMIVPLVDGTYTKAFMAELSGKDPIFTYKRTFLQPRKVINWKEARTEYSWVLKDEPAIYEIRVRYYDRDTKMEQATDQRFVFCCGLDECFDCYTLHTPDQIEAAIRDPVAFIDATEDCWDDYISEGNTDF